MTKPLGWIKATQNIDDGECMRMYLIDLKEPE
jgi:hypothetical protein